MLHLLAAVCHEHVKLYCHNDNHALLLKVMLSCAASCCVCNAGLARQSGSKFVPHAQDTHLAVYS